MSVRDAGSQVAEAIRQANRIALEIEGGISFQNQSITLFKTSTSGDPAIGSFTNYWAIRAKQANKFIDVPHYEIEIDDAENILTPADFKQTSIVRTSDGRTFTIKDKRVPLSQYDTWKLYGTISKA